jgi:hypothetical protein
MSPAAEPTQRPQAPRPRTLPLWPADAVPSTDEAEQALRAILAGDRGLDAELTARLERDLTPVERAAFTGGEAAPSFRAAAILRWRLGAALVTAPEVGRPFDAEAVNALVADTDEVLTALKTHADGAPEQGEVVGKIRAGVVRDAVALGNVVQQLATTAAGEGKVAVAKAVQAKLLSIVDGEAPQPEAERRSRKAWIALAVALAVGGGLHALELMRPAPERRAPPAGAPADAVVAPPQGQREIIMTRDGKRMPPGELITFREAQKLRGRRVVELAPGMYAVEPELSGGAKP